MNQAINELAAQEQKQVVAPTESVKITVSGFRGDEQPIEQVMHLDQQQGTLSGQSIAYVWGRIKALGGIVVDGDGGNKATFYPIEAFEKINIEVSPVIGVTLS